MLAQSWTKAVSQLWGWQGSVRWWDKDSAPDFISTLYGNGLQVDTASAKEMFILADTI